MRPLSCLRETKFTFDTPNVPIVPVRSAKNLHMSTHQSHNCTDTDGVATILRFQCVESGIHALEDFEVDYIARRLECNFDAVDVEDVDHSTTDELSWQLPSPRRQKFSLGKYSEEWETSSALIIL